MCVVCKDVVVERALVSGSAQEQEYRRAVDCVELYSALEELSTMRWKS